MGNPAYADWRAFEANVADLATHFRVFRPDRRGHGRPPDVDGPISCTQMARDTECRWRSPSCATCS